MRYNSYRQIKSGCSEMIEMNDLIGRQRCEREGQVFQIHEPQLEEEEEEKFDKKVNEMNEIKLVC